MTTLEVVSIKFESSFARRYFATAQLNAKHLITQSQCGFDFVAIFSQPNCVTLVGNTVKASCDRAPTGGSDNAEDPSVDLIYLMAVNQIRTGTVEIIVN